MILFDGQKTMCVVEREKQRLIFLIFRHADMLTNFLLCMNFSSELASLKSLFIDYYIHAFTALKRQLALFCCYAEVLTLG